MDFEQLSKRMDLLKIEETELNFLKKNTVLDFLKTFPSPKYKVNGFGSWDILIHKLANDDVEDFKQSLIITYKREIKRSKELIANDVDKLEKLKTDLEHFKNNYEK